MYEGVTSTKASTAAPEPAKNTETVKEKVTQPQPVVKSTAIPTVAITKPSTTGKIMSYAIFIVI